MKKLADKGNAEAAYVLALYYSNYQLREHKADIRPYMPDAPHTPMADFMRRTMKSRRDQQAVYNLMKERLKRDKARTHVLPISQLGLMEMTRQRAQESLSDTIYENCPYCGGRGVVKTTMSTSVELHRTLNTVMPKLRNGSTKI